MKTAFKPDEPPKVGSDFPVGRIDWHNPQITCFVLFVALRGMPASFGPTGGSGTAEWGKTETRWNLTIAFPSVLFLEELSPESQKPGLAILIDRRRSAHLQVARLFPGGGLPRPLPVDDQIDLRFTTIRSDSR